MKSMKKNIAVLGLGRVGLSLVEELSKLECQVLAIDKDPVKVARAAEFVQNAVICDVTDQEALEEAGMKEIDHAVIAFGSSTHDMVLSTVILKEIGVKELTVRVDDEYFNKIVLRLGATSVVSPQSIAGRSLAMRIASIRIEDYYKMVGDYGIATINVIKGLDKTIQEFDIRGRFGLNVLLISRNGKNIVARPSDYLMSGDKVTVFGTGKSITRFEEAINH